MITKGKLWEKIRTGLKDFDRSQKIAQNVMKRIRKMESETHPERNSKAD